MFKRLRRMRLNPNIREMLTQTTLHKKDFIYPLFITHGKNIRNPIESMPDVFQLSIDEALKECEALQNLGIFSIILFGIPKIKDSIGSEALSPEGIIAQATRAIKEKFPNMLVCVDLCFCEYTDHGHCGILNPKLNSVDNDLTLEILNQQALILAQSGADLIAPSAMMDGMIVSLRTMLDTNGFNHIPLMSYSTKFASGYYGPFRDVAQSTPSFGDRKSYQQNPANRREAILESLEDEAQGADILMVKPALAYLDIVRDIREQTLLPLAVYNVSGEYAMLKFAQKAGIIDYERVLLETMIGFKRAGADIIITYHAKEIANLI
ncbi:porphobilinogen synthase [Helicobacter sp. 14348-15]|uniref:Delta-aminolevulinic acid dehydratase n=1 Tax=Helicobacter colisuis TaxID=2949739 RepID=A0ABT0TVU5_9HELI|nr:MULTISPECIES: porphobilinogen synthase [Helicobacter]MCL9820053.1 porphobilinogen synthase [Helicobacter colisuis]MCL9820811.1 porphobilinogen synthase [Helicobacter colisuis]MDY5615978.1 porphobilinogen synthase [Helicobacter sp.]